MADKARDAVRTPRIGGPSDKVAPAALVVGGVLAALGFVGAFTVAGLVNGAAVSDPAVIGGVLVDHKLLLSQKIFYWHVPVAIASFGALVFAAWYAVRFLATRNAAFDARAKAATEIALVFVVCTMISGEMWTRFEWGVWWTWEPRLTTYLVLMLLTIGYFVLRNAVSDPERRAAYASVMSVLIFVDVPICFMVTRLIPSSIHPVVFRTDAGLSPDMLVPFLLSMVGMALVAFGLFRLRLRTQEIARRLAAVQESLEG